LKKLQDPIKINGRVSASTDLLQDPKNSRHSEVNVMWIQQSKLQPQPTLRSQCDVDPTIQTATGCNLF